MINFLALSLVFTSLLAAQVWSPNPANRKDDVILKEGHRVVVVESYDQNGHHNTKVSISPPQDPISAADGKFPSGNAKDKVKHGISSVVDSIPHFTGEDHSAGELIRDAVDNCKDSVSGAPHKAKDQVSETVHEGVAMKKEAAFKAKDKVENAYGKAKEKASETADATKEVVGKTKGKASEAVENAYGSAREKATEKAHVAKGFVQDAYGRAKEKATEKAHESKEKASNIIHGAKEAVEDAYAKTKDFADDTKDLGKTMVNDAARNVSKQVGNLKNLCVDGLRYLISGQWADPVFGVINLLGFAIAYGIGMWVTFISSHVLAGSLPRHQFGLVQSKIYPVYFRAMGSSIVTALLGHIGQHRNNLSKAAGLQVVNLHATLFAVFSNSFYLEPLATKVMMEKFRVEKEEGRGRETERDGAEEAIAEAEREEQRERMGRMNERLKRLNAYSSLLNIATLMGLSWHLVHLGHCIHGTT